MGRRKSSGAGFLALLILGIISAAVQFVAAHLTEVVVSCVVIAVIWGACALTRSKRPAGDALQSVTAPAKIARVSNRGPARSMEGDAFWIGPRGSAQVRERELGEMLYAGTGLRAIGNDEIEPALIDPRLPIARSVDECRERRLNYWPSYSTATEPARASYLQWLQSGRSEPSADIGYVFLYFYGLERRALHDSRTSATAAGEIPAIEAEVTRLLGLYGEQPSFRRYGSDFLDYSRAIRQPDRSYSSPPHPGRRNGLTFCDRLALAQCAHDEVPLPVEWAQHWVIHDPNTSLGVATRRCPDEFRKLFAQLYRDQFGAGLVLPLNRTRLTLQYRPASASFRGTKESLVFSPPLTDVTVLTGPVGKLAQVATQATEQLGSFSRLVAKDPAAAATFEGLVQLPVSLWPDHYRQQLESVRDIVSRAGQPAAIPFTKFRLWIPEVTELTRPKLKALSRALAGFGLAMEPDLRFGGSPPALDSRVVVFADDPPSAAEEASPRYQAAALTAQLAAAVAMADGSAGEAERALLAQQVTHWPNLTESERRRLQALLRLLFLQGPKLAGLRKKIELLQPTVREAVGDFLIQVAQADNDVSPQEIKALQKTFGLLGLDAERVFSKVHAAAVSATVAATRSSGKRTGYTIPLPENPQPARAVRKQKAAAINPLSLDPAKIAALQQDSERVAKLLAVVFENPAPGEEDSPGSEPPEETSANATVLGLDSKHSSLLKTLVTRMEWTRAELDELAEDRGLMVDGALERLNEASFEKLDMPLFDDGDPIRLNPDALAGVSGASHTNS